MLADREGVRQLGRAMHRALRAEPEADAVRLRDLRQAAVDRRRLLGPAGHAADEERRAEPLAEQRGADVDLVDRQLGERVVDEVDLLEERRLAGVLDLRRLAELEVGALAVADRLSHSSPPRARWRPAAARCLPPARRSARVPPTRPRPRARCRSRPRRHPKASRPPPPAAPRPPDARAPE